MNTARKEAYKMERFTAKPKWWGRLRHKARLTPSEFLVLDVIFDKTIDWQKTTDRISISQFQDELGMSNKGVINSLKSLSKKGLIFLLKQERKTNTISIKMSAIEAYANTPSSELTSQDKSTTSELSSQTGELSSYQLVNSVHTHDTRYHYPIPYMSIFLKKQKENPCKAFNKKEKLLNIPFDTFWDLYDYKSTNKKTAQAKWSRLTNKQRQAVIEHLPAYVKSTPDKKYRKHPISYLNQEHWNTPIETSNSPATKPQGHDPLAVNQQWQGANQSNIVESNTTLEDMMGSW